MSMLLCQNNFSLVTYTVHIEDAQVVAAARFQEGVTVALHYSIITPWAFVPGSLFHSSVRSSSCLLKSLHF